MKLFSRTHSLSTYLFTKQFGSLLLELGEFRCLLVLDAQRYTRFTGNPESCERVIAGTQRHCLSSASVRFRISFTPDSFERQMLSLDRFEGNVIDGLWGAEKSGTSQCRDDPPDFSFDKGYRLRIRCSTATQQRGMR